MSAEDRRDSDATLAQRAMTAAFRALRGRGITAIPGGKSLVDLVKRRYRRPYGYVHGFPMEFDKTDNLRLSIFGVYEPVETEIVRSAVRPGDVALDIGANIGYYTILLSSLVGNSGRVFAFEPSQENFSILQRNVNRNRLGNVEPVNAAVGAESGSANLYLSSTNPGDHHVFDTHVDAACIVVPTRLVALDAFLDPTISVDFVKIDIQGAEPAALAGMQETLQRKKDVKMLVEFWPSGMYRAGFEPSDFLDLVSDLGFRYLHVDQREKRLVSISRAALLETEWIVEKSTNLFLFRD